MIKAIPTVYRGVQMRSKLEAATARTLDQVGIAWLYEAEGYDIDGTWYLPDFWLPDRRWFVEVKGVLDDSLRKPEALAVQVPEGVQVFVVDGQGFCWHMTRERSRVRLSFEHWLQGQLTNYQDARRDCVSDLLDSWRTPTPYAIAIERSRRSGVLDTLTPTSIPPSTPPNSATPNAGRSEEHTRRRHVLDLAVKDSVILTSRLQHALRNPSDNSIENLLDVLVDASSRCCLSHLYLPVVCGWLTDHGVSPRHYYDRITARLRA